MEFHGFGFDDDDDVFGNVYAFTYGECSPEQVVDIEFSANRLAALGLDAQTVLTALSGQNQIMSPGSIQTAQERILIRVSGQFDDVAALAEAPLRIGGVFSTLNNVAEVTSDHADPPSERLRFNGAPAIGFKVRMRDGAHILDFGHELDTLMTQRQAELPIDIPINTVADQPHVVEESVGHFLKALGEAVVIM